MRHYKHLSTKERECLLILRKIGKTITEIAKENDIKGIFYWEPLWIPGENICWASKEGQKYINEEGKSTRNEWANQCLFDYEGNCNPAFHAFKIKE